MSSLKTITAHISKYLIFKVMAINVHAERSLFAEWGGEKLPISHNFIWLTIAKA